MYAHAHIPAGCCQQLRVNLAKHLALKEEAERRKTLVK